MCQRALDVVRNVEVHIKDARRGVKYQCLDRNCRDRLIPVFKDDVWMFRHWRNNQCIGVNLPRNDGYKP